eukprot:TRINITY_DN2469_c0_g3_i1.p1 TRINITY_DN2469_c0_g3~~TRINITY_DN2469_c0_g3_i1.p1  ORF type:complete len:748 (+),score=112.07 TRINITY_DN2469_c0_g3_i1:567-2810(+)
MGVSYRLRLSDMSAKEELPMPSPIEEKVQTVGHYQIGKTIGEGTFGKVKLGIHLLTGEKVAVKILEKDKIADAADVERVSREIHILKVLRHPNIIQLYEIIETPTQLYLIMEYASGGELFEYIVSHNRVKEKEACRFFQQIIRGVEYIHKLRVVHRDLKPENLLLDHNLNIKIVDFGLSNTYQEGELLKTACGSPCYAAPEMIAGKRYVGLQVDIWSCGVIMFALICGFLPFEDPNTANLYKKIIAGEFNVPKFVSEEAKDLLRAILNTDPNKRITISEIRRHPWYQLHKNDMEPDPTGILVGVDPIPIDSYIVRRLEENGFDAAAIVQSIKGNRHNHLTTTYYLLLQKLLRSGGVSNADLLYYTAPSAKAAAASADRALPAASPARPAKEVTNGMPERKTSNTVEQITEQDQQPKSSDETPPTSKEDRAVKEAVVAAKDVPRNFQARRSSATTNRPRCEPDVMHASTNESFARTLHTVPSPAKDKSIIFPGFTGRGGPSRGSTDNSRQDIPVARANGDTSKSPRGKKQNELQTSLFVAPNPSVMKSKWDQRRHTNHSIMRTMIETLGNVEESVDVRLEEEALVTKRPNNHDSSIATRCLSPNETLSVATEVKRHTAANIFEKENVSIDKRLSIAPSRSKQPKLVQEDSLRIHSGPLNLNAIYRRNPRALITEIVRIAEKGRFVTKQVRKYSAVFTFDGVTLEVEVKSIKDLAGFYTTKVKRLSGSLRIWTEACDRLLSGMATTIVS